MKVVVLRHCSSAPCLPSNVLAASWTKGQLQYKERSAGYGQIRSQIAFEQRDEQRGAINIVCMMDHETTVLYHKFSAPCLPLSSYMLAESCAKVQLL